ncbi:uncharacterized protein [Periplaneta americana]
MWIRSADAACGRHKIRRWCFNRAPDKEGWIDISLSWFYSPPTRVNSSSYECLPWRDPSSPPDNKMVTSTLLEDETYPGDFHSSLLSNIPASHPV